MMHLTIRMVDASESDFVNEALFALSTHLRFCVCLNEKRWCSSTPVLKTGGRRVNHAAVRVNQTGPVRLQDLATAIQLNMQGATTGRHSVVTDRPPCRSSVGTSHQDRRTAVRLCARFL